mmetsp:Transcript_36182/g.76803  ORF Transcript_36182/g.76803 Transcript_36182/m.76803 type:complete len:179 (+) Transcript_36182:35-571(+)|eukprot:CAMPEP_0204361174 /NCGR_PEP_ID=MMETSP0469-20131031/38625_1 /ASSEMBLY_ACC=CAM_ASM_000384 /TAXON_ID=2969 /ORGANISM="Oxyrrhis marina" /LENGTH=178 /DNA_ID=CAMNT_0051349531 /DNA_START=11 /DNA_END=547 /DNA_ORIENTATION=-
MQSTRCVAVQAVRLQTRNLTGRTAAYARVQHLRVQDDPFMGITTRKVANSVLGFPSITQPSYKAADIQDWRESDSKLQSLSDEELLALREQFDERAMQGKLSFSEFQKVLDDKLCGCIPESDLPNVAVKAWHELDKDGDNLLSFEEFAKCELVWDCDAPVLQVASDLFLRRVPNMAHM